MSMSLPALHKQFMQDLNSMMDSDEQLKVFAAYIKTREQMQGSHVELLIATHFGLARAGDGSYVSWLQHESESWFRGVGDRNVMEISFDPATAAMKLAALGCKVRLEI
jgi:hypothetical protein